MVTAIDGVNLEEAYRAAHAGAIAVGRSSLGMLKFTGRTRLDLLHRMSTQDVKALGSGEGAATILTTEIGRMIDRLILYASSDSVYALTGEHNGDNIARYLMRFVFFQDDFHIEDLSAQTTIFGVYGKQAREKVQSLFEADVDLVLHHWRELALGETTVYVHRTDAVTGDGYFVMCQAEARELVWQRLLEAGITPAAEEAFDYLRIEEGLPRFGREITPEFIPLEAGLWSDVSFRKGCYTGQEIIARMESRGRLARQLVQLRGENALVPGMAVEAGGRNVGEITSAGDGPAGSLALAYLKTRALNEEDGPALEAGGAPVQMVRELRR